VRRGEIERESEKKNPGKRNVEMNKKMKIKNNKSTT
jgi:hypothetical protein